MSTARTATESAIAGLHVAEWPGASGTVIGLPGLTSTHRVWSHLADQRPDLRVVSADLRGRGGSFQAGGPYGLAQHARDIARVAEELDLRDVVLVGHSMGAFLAPVAARELGDRVRSLVLVDGGVPPKLPLWMKPFAVKAAFSMALKKVEKDWPSAEAYAEIVRGKSLQARPELRAAVTEWCAYDLGGGVRPRFDREAIVGDALNTFFGDDVLPALEALRVPAHLIWATAGKDDKSRPLYKQAVVDRWVAQLPTLTAERVVANHVTVMFDPAVIKALG